VQSSLGAALTVSCQRFVGTALGSSVGAIVATYFGPRVLALGVGVFILGLLCAATKVDRSAYRFGGDCAGDCALGAADGLRMANRISSVCGSLYRNCCGVIFDAGMAGTRIPVDTMNCYVRAHARNCLADRQC
jgi:hypothetical protein